MTFCKNELMPVGKSAFIVAFVACFIFLAVNSQPEPPLTKLPPGFVVSTKMIYPTQISIEAMKPHNAKSCIFVDPDIHLAYSWTAMTEAAAQMVAAGMITQEQESSDIGGLKTQPDGKEQFENGTLVFTKSARLQIGTHCPAWITYKGTWVGVASDGLLAVSVSNVPGSKENIKGWVEAMLK